MVGQIAPLTREERHKLYMKSTKTELVEIILNLQDLMPHKRLPVVIEPPPPGRMIKEGHDGI